MRVRFVAWMGMLRMRDRGFSSAPVLSKPAPIPRLPKKPKISGRNQAGPPVEQRTRWPTKVLQDAARSGFLKLPPAIAIEVLDAFASQGSASARQLCTGHGIDPNVLTVLSRILLRSEFKSTARDLLLASARLGDREAILLVIKSAIRSNDLKNIKVSSIYQLHFRPMLQAKHPAALFLEGQKAEKEGHPRQALCIFEEAIAASDAHPFEIMADISPADIGKAVGRLRASNGDHEGAQAALSTAALHYDDLDAHFQLAKNYINPYSQDYKNFMLKAAASGNVEAAYELGVLYLKHFHGGMSQTEKARFVHGSGVDKLNNEENRNEAQEWFSVAAESGHVGSQLYLAITLHGSGNYEDGSRWLNVAKDPQRLHSESSQEWAPAVSYISDQWDDAKSDLMNIDVDSLRKTGSIKLGIASHAYRI